MQDTVHQIKLVSERQRFLNQSRNISQDGQKILTVSMPGRIVKVMAGVGQSVKRGDGVIIVEAMKMENEIRAPKDGVIQAIHVKAGDAVEAGEPLVTLQ
jgi:pyruvate carboxylase subunit B